VGAEAEHSVALAAREASDPELHLLEVAQPAVDQLGRARGGAGPDVVTLDLSMPGTDGGKVFEALRRDAELADIRVCIITGRPELRRLIYDRPVPPPEGYLDKPVDDETLLRNVRKILEVSET